MVAVANSVVVCLEEEAVGASLAAAEAVVEVEEVPLGLAAKDRRGAMKAVQVAMRSA